MAEATPDYTTILGPDAKIKGDLSFDSAAKVLGHIEGSIKSKGKLLIANGSRCHAAISAKEVAVEGHIEGNVQASDRIELKPSGRITGDIVSARMTMADGAAIEGHVRIGLDGKGEAGGKSTSATEPKVAAQAQAQAHAKAR